MLIKNFAKDLIRRALPATAFRLGLRNHYWDEIEMEFLDLIVDRTRAAVDVGANSGRYAAALSKIALHVYAIEPNPIMARLLSAGCDKKRVTVLHRAASDSNGTATLSIPTDQWGNGGENIASLDRSFSGPIKTHRVLKMMLDDLADANIGFIKIDVEGHELAALRGGKRLFDKCHPVVLIECDELARTSTPPSFEFLLARGYEGYFVYSRQFYPLAELKPFMFDLAAFKEPRPRKLVSYTNNFLFFPRSKMTPDMFEQISRRLLSSR
jgi:FkbM family methyltransferase